MPKKLVVICLLNFFIAAFMGLALRFSFLESIGINYRYLTHAHSHVAMLGWVYLVLFTLFVHYFIPEKKPIYTNLFWLTEVAVVGMMVSFPFQGYAAVSISFSTLHILCSYYFVFLIWKNHKTNSFVTKSLLQTALVFMVVSTAGVWCLGPAVSLQGKASAFYQIAIQFFLHFQFNGWFLIAVVTLFFHLLTIKDSFLFRRFLLALIVSTILTFALPIQWFAPYKFLYWMNGAGIILQLVTLYLFIKLITPKLPQFLKNKSKLLVHLLYFSLFCFCLKILLFTLSILPEFSQTVYTHQNFVIGFIHLMMLGIISGFLFSFLIHNGILTPSKKTAVGVYSFLLGFLVTEVLLTIQGCYFYFGSGMLPNYYLLLFLASSLLPLGIFFILLNFIKTTSYEATKTT